MPLGGMTESEKAASLRFDIVVQANIFEPILCYVARSGDAVFAEGRSR